MIFLVTYDLRRPGQDYPALIEALNKYPDKQHPMGSVWFIKGHSLLTTKAIYEDLVRYIDKDDQLYVTQTEVSNGWMSLTFWAWFNS